MRKILLPTLLFSLFVLCFSVTVTASEPYIRDDVGYLGDYEISALESELSRAEAELGFKVRVYVSSSELYTSELPPKFGLSSADDVAILHIFEESDTIYYSLYTYGIAEELSDSTVNAVLDNSEVYSGLKNGRLADGISAFAEALCKQKASADKNGLKSVIITSVCLGLAAGGITVGVILHRYKKKLKSPIYPLSKFARMDLEHSTDSFLGSTITRTRISDSSSRGGSSGGSGGSFRGKR